MANIAIFRINYKSDFILTLESDAGWMTPFCIKFWTGAPSQAYFAGWDGTTYTNCAYDPAEPTKLTVQFDDHNLPIGELKFQIGYHFTVADFPTTIEDEVINQASVIIEVDGEPAQVMLDFNGETAPEIQFSLPAYANEAQRIANEEERERIFSEMQEENATAVAEAENVNAELSGTILTVTNRDGVSTSKNVQGPQGPKGEDGSDADVTAENIASALGYTPQEELVSGTNIKTINNISLLGSGNIDIQGGGGTQVQSNWNETDTSSPAYIKNKPTIPAAQVQADWNVTNTSSMAFIKNKPTIPVVTGKADKVSGAESGDFAGLDANGNLTDSGKKASDFQVTLVSGTNIKTINSTSLLGSGDVSVGTYSKPSGGIPKTDFASAVQTSLGKADTAVQPAAIANLESKMAIVAASGTTLTASVDNYYLFSSAVGTLAITLTTPSDTTHITKAVFMLTTGSSPAVTFAGASGINVIAQDGFSIEASTTYEINAIYNGVAWVVACMKLSTTPINS